MKLIIAFTLSVIPAIIWLSVDILGPRLTISLPSTLVAVKDLVNH